MLMRLTAEQIEEFASRKNVKRIPVENFLMTVTNNKSVGAAIFNLRKDAQLYGWSAETEKAIDDGITLSGGLFD